jgi:hypothetical protein
MNEANTGLPIEIERIEVDANTVQSVYQAGYSRITEVQKRVEGPGYHVQRKLIVSNSWHNRTNWTDQSWMQ